VDFTPLNWGQGRGITSATLVNPNQTAVSFVAPAHLPNGATISKMVVYFIDNANPNLDLQVWLYRCDLALGTCEGLIYGQSAHAYPDHQIYELLPVGNTLVDLQSSYYLVEVHIPASPLIGVTGIRIDYGYPVSLPVIMR
jgi:hypothetical protein